MAELSDNDRKKLTQYYLINILKIHKEEFDIHKDCEDYLCSVRNTTGYQMWVLRVALKQAWIDIKKATKWH